MARLWLEERADARSDASQSEQISIARSAKDAAWAAAEEARSANTTAKIAATIAAMALIIAIAALGWQIFGPHQS